MSELAPVSYVIPVFNGAAFIADAVNSLRRQTLRPAEIVVVDDGSTDATAEIVRTLVADEPGIIIRLIQQANAGTAAALNTAITATTQPYIGILGADDQALAERTAIQVALLEARPDVGLVYADGYICHPTPSGITRTATRFSDEVSFARGWVFSRLLRKNFIPAPSVMVRWTALAAVGGHNPRLFHEDWDLWLRLSRLFPVDYTPQPLVDYRRHPGARSANRWRRFRHRMWVWCRALGGAYSLTAVRHDAQRLRLERGS